MDKRWAVRSRKVELWYFEWAIFKIDLPLFDIFLIIEFKLGLDANVVWVLALTMRIPAKWGAAYQKNRMVLIFVSMNGDWIIVFSVSQRVMESVRWWEILTWLLKVIPKHYERLIEEPILFIFCKVVLEFYQVFLSDKIFVHFFGGLNV